MKTQAKPIPSIQIDPPDWSRPYWVWWEGTEPFACTANEAEAQIWIARLTLSEAHYQDQRTSFAENRKIHKSDDLALSAFEELPEKVRAYILNDLEEYQLERIAGMVQDLGGERPNLIDTAGCDKFIALGDAECYVHVFWALRAPRFKYSVGWNTGDDYNEQLETMADCEAALRLAVMAFESKAREKLKTIEA